MLDDTNNAIYDNPDDAYQVAWIVYINGLECPVQSVDTQYGVWKIPEATINLVPDASMQRFGAEDRVNVQVFYCDYWVDPDNPTFRLLYDGEVVSWSYNSMQKQRMLSLHCVDYMQIFTQIFFFFMSNVDDIAIGASGESIGVDITGVHTAGNATLFPYSLFAEGLVSPDNQQAPLIKRPIDLVYNVVRALTYSTLPSRSVPAANFFSPWAKKSHFNQRFIALPFLESSEDEGVFPILRAVKADFAVSAAARLASSIGSAGSIWQMLEQVLKTMMMELSMLPTPSAVHIDKYPTNDSTGLSIVGAPGDTATTNTHTVLTNYMVKPQFFFGLPPSCNVFYPSQILRFTYNENYITQPTRMYFNEESWLAYMHTDSDTTAGLSAILRDALSVAYPEEANAAILAAAEHQGANGKNVLIYPEEFFKGPVVDRRPLPRWFTFLAQAQQADRAGGDTPAAVSPDAPSTTPAADSTRDVYRLYAKYEFYKERYKRRNGTVQLAFNPYPVPGFPMALFDRRSTQVDILAYVVQVNQHMSARGWGTTVQFSYGRTLQESFQQLQKQFEVENTIIEEQANPPATPATPTPANADAPAPGEPATAPADAPAPTVPEEPDAFFGAGDVAQHPAEPPPPAPVGAIAIAPPEPIQEIRDVVQNFTRAEAFYRSLFYGAAPANADDITVAQAQGEADRRETEEQVTAQTEAHDTAVAQDQVASGIVVPPAPEVAPPAQAAIAPDPVASSAAAPILENRRASFQYHEIIEFIDSEGQREGIQIQGLDATSRLRLLALLDKMDAGTATEDELAVVRQGVQRPELAQQDPEDIKETVTTTLQSVRTAIRSVTTQSNVSGDREVVPTAAGLPRFESYGIAMQAAARPICTLDEYILFLGPDGVREGEVDPATTLAAGDTRAFPAKYYQRIRHYRPGPPPAIPAADYMNAATVSTEEGGTVAVPGADTTDSSVISVPATFPETRRDWDAILQAYRDRVLDEKLAQT